MPSPIRRILVLAAALLGALWESAPAQAAPAPECFYYATVQVEIKGIPRNGFYNTMVLLDVIKVPRDTPRGKLVGAVQNYITANKEKIGYVDYERIIRGLSDCYYELSFADGFRKAEIAGAKEQLRKPKDWLKKVVPLHGVWFEQGEDSGLSMITEFDLERAPTAGTQRTTGNTAGSSAKTPSATLSAIAQTMEALSRDDQLRALEVLENAAQDNYRARIILINRYDKKLWNLKPDDLQRHVAQLRQSADAGNAFGMTMLGMVFQYGIGDIGKDKKQALALYENAAMLGNPLAMVMLGRLYDFDGSPEIGKDLAKAGQWYNEAVTAGDAHGMYNWTTLYPDKQKTDEQKAETKMLLHSAAVLGFPTALHVLAECADAECIAFGKKEAEISAPHGQAYQAFFGANPVKTYRDAKPWCTIEETYAQTEMSLGVSVSYDKDTFFYLNRCVTEFGYLPSPAVRTWMLKHVKNTSENRQTLKTYFALEDFDESYFPFTHQDRVKRSDAISETLSGFRVRYGGYYDYDCSYPRMPSFIDNRRDLNNAISDANAFANCNRRFLQSLAKFDHAARIKEILPAYAYMTPNEQKKVGEEIADAGRGILAKIKEDQISINDHIEEGAHIVGSLERSRAQNAAELKTMISNMAQQMNDYAERLRPPPPPNLAEFNRIVEEQERSNAKGGGRANEVGGQTSSGSGQRTGNGPGAAGSAAAGKNGVANQDARAGTAGNPSQATTTGTTNNRDGTSSASKAGTAGKSTSSSSSGNASRASFDIHFVTMDPPKEYKPSLEEESEARRSKAERQKIAAENRAAEKAREDARKASEQQHIASCAALASRGTYPCGCPSPPGAKTCSK
ncbi:tetratricopeptide repeat protein [Ralstonia soli]|uniref:Sel1 repeat family protein n=1 Tax=Ralstonia soli TaxID=2953896 RepID=A0ABT1ATL2_9RALS|nr:tetratricopeptide repeat protein [Ralstonia soli]MCO5401581.1 sel1 repeat family protein [Ralstonia soli]